MNGAHAYGAFAQAVARSHPPAAQFGQLGPEGTFQNFVSLEDINSQAAKMTQLNSDIINFYLPEHIEGTVEQKIKHFYDIMELLKFKSRWSEFYFGWVEWVDTHYGMISRWGEDAVQEFMEYQRLYNDWRRRWIEDWSKFGAKTAAPHVEERGPDVPGPIEKVSGTISLVAIAVIAVAGVLALRTFQQEGMLGKKAPPPAPTPTPTTRRLSAAAPARRRKVTPRRGRRKTTPRKTTPRRRRAAPRKTKR